MSPAENTFFCFVYNGTESISKGTDAKSKKRLVGGKTKERGFLQPCLSEFYHHSPSAFTFPPNINFCLFTATRESLRCVPSSKQS